MMPLLNVLDFLIQVLCTLYIYTVIIRILLGLTRADFYNPFSQFILTVTNPVLRLPRQWIPGIGRLDTAGVVFIVMLKFVELSVRGWLAGMEMAAGSLFIAVILGLLDSVVKLFIVAIIILVLTSWIATYSHTLHNPLTSVLRSITEPILNPARKIIPSTGMFDLSPLVALIALYCAHIFLHSIYA